MSEFGKSDAAVVKDLMPTFVEAIEAWTKEGIVPVMNRFNRKSQAGES